MAPNTRRGNLGVSPSNAYLFVPSTPSSHPLGMNKRPKGFTRFLDGTLLQRERECDSWSMFLFTLV